MEESFISGSQSFQVNPVDDAPKRTAGGVFDLTIFEDAPATSLELTGIEYNPGGSGQYTEADQTITFSITQTPDSFLMTSKRLKAGFYKQVTQSPLKSSKVSSSTHHQGNTVMASLASQLQTAATTMSQQKK